MDEGILKTIGLCQILHGNTQDRSGYPYWKHPVRVMLRARRASLERDTALVSLLHDVLEDCDITQDDLLFLGFTKSVVYRVNLLTTRSDSYPTQFERLNSYKEYINNLLSKEDRIVRVVKLADIADNSSPDRTSGLNQYSAFKYRLALKQFEDYPTEPVMKGPVSLGHLAIPNQKYLLSWEEKIQDLDERKETNFRSFIYEPVDKS